MRRAALVIVFAILGLVSLWYWAAVDAWACDQFPNRCIGKGCHEIGECPISFWQATELIAVIFGPSAVFGWSAFIFSRSRRRWTQWLALVVGLITVHWTFMFVER